MNRQDPPTPPTPTINPGSDCELDDRRSLIINDAFAHEAERRALELAPTYGPACREPLSTAARALLAILARASLQRRHVQLVGGQMQTARALERRSMISMWRHFEPKTSPKVKRPTFAQITARGREVLIAWERGNVAESDYTPGLHTER